MQTKETNAMSFTARLKAQAARAMERLRALGARDIKVNGIRAMYIPGNVNMCASWSPDSYGEFIASRKRSQKHFLRANHLGRFRKGRH